MNLQELENKRITILATFQKKTPNLTYFERVSFFCTREIICDNLLVRSKLKNIQKISPTKNDLVALDLTVKKINNKYRAYRCYNFEIISNKEKDIKNLKKRASYKKLLQNTKK
jgi:hypothetical protein